MSFQANFTAIDFETANRRRDSACQLAAVVVRDGKLVDERMWMIRPDPFFFSPGNIRIHGIRPHDVESEPTFGELWGEIAEFLDGDCLIAHNAPFDVGVILGCLERHQLPVADLHFSCTRLIARQTWPDRQRFGLKPLSDWLGVQFKHHDALEDSRACAKVLLAAGIAREAESLVDLEQKLRIVRGKAGPWGVSQAAKIGGGKRKTTAKTAKTKTKPGLPKRTLRRGSGPRLPLPPSQSVDPFDMTAAVGETAANYDLHSPSSLSVEINFQRLAIRAEFIQPMRGKRIVICGRLKTISDQQAIDLAVRAGGIHQNDVDSQTNCVVIGSVGVDTQQMQSLVDRGTLEILSETDFLKQLGL